MSLERRKKIWRYLAVVVKSAMPSISDDENALIEPDPLPVTKPLAKQLFWERQDVDAPATAYVSLDDPIDVVVGKETRMTDQAEEDGSDLVESVIMHKIVDVVVNVRSDNAYNDAQLIQAAMSEAASIEALHISKLGIVSCGGINNLSTVVDGVWKGRANFTIKFGYAYVKQKVVPAIAKVPVNIDITGDEENEVEILITL